MSSMLWAWRVQLRTINVAHVAFEPLGDHNGYIQIDLLRQHPSDELFDGELFLYYPEYQNPPAHIIISRNASGRFASSVIESSLVPWSKEKAFSKQVPLVLRTPGMSHRQFSFDSPDFEFTLNFNPPIRPSVVRFVNRTDTFHYPRHSRHHGMTPAIFRSAYRLPATPSLKLPSSSWDSAPQYLIFSSASSRLSNLSRQLQRPIFSRYGRSEVSFIVRS